LLRDSMRMWWRFAPGAAGFAVGGLDDTGAPATTAEDVPQA
jgi:hypothetical protein